MNRHDCISPDERYRREIGFRIVGQRCVEHLVEDRRAVGRYQQRVTVRLGLRHLRRTDGTAGSTPVLDDELLA